MSLLLRDRVYTMEDKTSKRGVYPLHGYKLGLYRLPITLEDPLEIKSVHDGLKTAFATDMYADRIYATYAWKERNMADEDSYQYREANLNVTVEIVTGEVVDIIYQVFPIEKFGDPQWVQGYRKKADHYAKMIIDTILRNTLLGDKMIRHYMDSDKISAIEAEDRLEALTPLAKIIDGKPEIKVEVAPETGAPVPEAPVLWDTTSSKPGPIDVEYKSKMPVSAPYDADGYSIKTWGRKGTDNKVMGVWGEFVSVDFDICVADGACIDACPVDVYEFFPSPGNSASGKKPLMSKETDCIFCLACEGVCPPKAIKIFEMK